METRVRYGAGISKITASPDMKSLMVVKPGSVNISQVNRED
jgi:hypothetical protein